MAAQEASPPPPGDRRVQQPFAHGEEVTRTNEHMSQGSADAESGNPHIPLRRRILVGPSHERTGFWSPMPQLSTRGADMLAEEGNQLANVLIDRGTLSRRELRMAVGSRYWGPQRFRAALRYALDHRLIRRVGREKFAAPEHAPGEKKEEGEPEIH